MQGSVCLGFGRAVLGETESPEQTGKKMSLFLKCTLQTQEGRKQEAQRCSRKTCDGGWWREGVRGLLGL